MTASTSSENGEESQHRRQSGIGNDAARAAGALRRRARSRAVRGAAAKANGVKLKKMSYIEQNISEIIA